MKKENKTAYSALTQNFDLLINAPMKNYTSFKVGGPADFLAMPKKISELQDLLRQAQKLDMDISLFGGGSNILVTDKGIRGLVIITKQLDSQISILKTDPHAKTILAGAGARMSKVCQLAINNALSGLEFAAGLPGTLGGALTMNAGTSSENIAGIVESIDVLDPKTFEVKTFGKDLLDFSYRSLTLQGFIVSATLKLHHGIQEIIKETVKKNLVHKNATQPVAEASAGCFFKNPNPKQSAGELIDKSGLKGKRINDAMVSKKHANFIVNLDNATCDDILLLKQHIQDTVFKKYNINLKPEVRIKGE